jgi:hypothetical protein
MAQSSTAAAIAFLVFVMSLDSPSCVAIGAAHACTELRTHPSSRTVGPSPKVSVSVVSAFPPGLLALRDALAQRPRETSCGLLAPAALRTVGRMPLVRFPRNGEAAG